MINPLLELFEIIEGGKDIPVNHKIRAWCNRHFSWAIPTEEVVAEIVKHSPIVEIGCGLGYWASFIQAAGGKILPFDWGQQAVGNRWGTRHFQICLATATDVFQNIIPEKEHNEYALFLCWAGVTSVVKDCLDNFKGKTILYIGHYRGINGWDERLASEWKVEKEMPVPNWYGHSDKLYVFRRVP